MRHAVLASGCLMSLVMTGPASGAAAGPPRKGDTVFLSFDVPAAIFPGVETSHGFIDAEVGALPACSAVVLLDAPSREHLRVSTASGNLGYDISGEFAARVHARAEDCQAVERAGPSPRVDPVEYRPKAGRDVARFLVHVDLLKPDQDSSPRYLQWLPGASVGPWKPEPGQAVFVAKRLTNTSGKTSVGSGTWTLNQTMVGDAGPAIPVVVSSACEPMLLVTVKPVLLVVKSPATKTSYEIGQDWPDWVHRTKDECDRAVKEQKRPPATEPAEPVPATPGN